MAKDKSSKTKSTKGAASKRSGEGLSFFPNSWKELKKVHTPTRQEAMQASLVVIVMLAFMAVCLGIFDFGWGQLMQFFLS